MRLHRSRRLAGQIQPGARLDRYHVVRIDVPDKIWASRQVLGRPPAVGWDAIPEGRVSRDLGSAWLTAARSALLSVPSAIIDEEANVLINPVHPDAAKLTATKVRRFIYDHRV